MNNANNKLNQKRENKTIFILNRLANKMHTALNERAIYNNKKKKQLITKSTQVNKTSIVYECYNK